MQVSGILTQRDRVFHSNTRNGQGEKAVFNSSREIELLSAIAG
jgi:hypothetical protein